MKPKQVSHGNIQENCNGSGSYLPVNRNIDHAERMRQLYAVLGRRISSEDNTSATKSTTVSYNSSDCSKDSEVSTFTIDIISPGGTVGEIASAVQSKLPVNGGASGSIKEIARGACPSNVHGSNTPSESSLFDGRCSNGRAASNTADVHMNYFPDGQSRKHTVLVHQDPVAISSAKSSFITDNPSDSESHVPSHHVQAFESQSGNSSPICDQRKLAAVQERDGHFEVCGLDQETCCDTLDSGNESDCETDFLIEKDSSAVSNDNRHCETLSDTEVIESPLGSSKLLSSSYSMS